MTLVQLSYVVAIDRHRHFGRAAEHCHVTQPTLSMQVRRLEEELGIELFDRSKHPIEPTDLGAQVIDQARMVLDETERIRELVDASRDTLQGTLRIGMLSTLAPYLLPLFLQPFHQRYPQIHLTIEELQTDHILENLRRGELDAGLVATPEPARHLTERALFREPFVGYISEQHPLFDNGSIRPQDLHRDGFWLLKEGHCFRDQALHLCQETNPDQPPEDASFFFESGSLETLKRLVEQYGGFTLLPHLATLDLQAEQRRLIRPFQAPQPTRLIRLLHRKTYLKKNLIEVCVEEMLRALPDAVELADPLPIAFDPAGE